MDLLTPELMYSGLQKLSDDDPQLASVFDEFGTPPLRRRPPGFATMVRIIIEQQLSVASANSTLARLDSISGLSARRILGLHDEALRAAGLSRQKTGYIKGLADLVVADKFSFDRLASMSDSEAFATLTRIRGVGRWSAEIYLMFVLGRPDIWPAKDVAIIVGVQRALQLPERPDFEEMDRIGDRWRPWRSAVAHLLWQSYDG